MIKNKKIVLSAMLLTSSLATNNSYGMDRENFPKDHGFTTNYPQGNSESNTNNFESNKYSNVKTLYKSGELCRKNKNYEEALNFFSVAAFSNDNCQNNKEFSIFKCATLYKLGKMFESGKGVCPDQEKTFNLYKMAADSPHATPLIHYLVSFCYNIGKGVEINKEKEIDYLLKAVNCPYPLALELPNPNNPFPFTHYDYKIVAQLHLARLYDIEKVKENDSKKIFDLLNSAANSIIHEGSFSTAISFHRSGAQYMLGRLYDIGDYPLAAEDPVTAFKYYKMAADNPQGEAQFQYEVGCKYLNGDGVDENFKEALNYFTLSANRGCEYAQTAIEIIQKNNFNFSNMSAIDIYNISYPAERNRAAKITPVQLVKSLLDDPNKKPEEQTFQVCSFNDLIKREELLDKNKTEPKNNNTVVTKDDVFKAINILKTGDVTESNLVAILTMLVSPDTAKKNNDAQKIIAKIRNNKSCPGFSAERFSCLKILLNNLDEKNQTKNPQKSSKNQSQSGPIKLKINSNQAQKKQANSLRSPMPKNFNPTVSSDLQKKEITPKRKSNNNSPKPEVTLTSGITTLPQTPFSLTLDTDKEVIETINDQNHNTVDQSNSLLSSPYSQLEQKGTSKKEKKKFRIKIPKITKWNDKRKSKTINNNSNETKQVSDLVSQSTIKDYAESHFSISISESECSKSEISENEEPINIKIENRQLFDEIHMEYPHIFGAMEKNGLDNLTQVKIKNKMVIINTLIEMYQKGFIEGAIGGGKINVNFCSNGNIKFVTHTTHAKWYRDKVVVKEFLTFIAKCDPLFAEYSLSIFGNDCFARDVSEKPDSANTSKPE